MIWNAPLRSTTLSEWFYGWQLTIISMIRRLQTPHNTISLYYSTLTLQIVSPAICEAMDSQEIRQYFEDSGYIRLIQCFLFPRKYMIQQNEVDQNLYVDKKGNTGSTETDPIYQLFVPDDDSKLGLYNLAKERSYKCSPVITDSHADLWCSPNRSYTSSIHCI